MAATRTPFTSASGIAPGDEFVDEVSDNVRAMWPGVVLNVTAIGGTANAITGTITPDFDGSGLIDRMPFVFSPTAPNTGGATLTLNSQPAVPILNFDGSALTGGELQVGSLYLLIYANGAFALMNGAALGQTVQFGTSTFTADGTWIKPVGLDDNRQIFVELWGAGGGGAIAGNADRGGGGGGYISKMFRAADLPASVPVTIPLGGAIETDGGNATFGTLLTAGGGQRGGFGAGLEGQGGAPGGIVAYRNTAALDAMTIWHGGSGARGARGGHAVFGGAGGGASGLVAGVSQFGGDGGANGAPGSAPGGGGGEGAPGGRGECRVALL